LESRDSRPEQESSALFGNCFISLPILTLNLREE
jgi:hypothetical protein